VLLDVVMRRISDPALRVLLAIVRKTYGFQKQSDRISLTQLQNFTGLGRQSTVNGIKALGSLITVKVGKREGNEYTLNLNVATGELVQEMDQSKKWTSPKIAKTLVHLVDTQNIIRTKPNISRPADTGFEKAWSLYPKRAGGNSKKNALAKWTARIRTGVDPTELIAGVERYANYVRATGKEGTEYVKQAATFFGAGEHWKEKWEIPAHGRQRSGGFVG
jgi:phage replication O-like protein O